MMTRGTPILGNLHFYASICKLSGYIWHASYRVFCIPSKASTNFVITVKSCPSARAARCPSLRLIYLYFRKIKNLCNWYKKLSEGAKGTCRAAPEVEELQAAGGL